jgi:hypothetical protein
VQFVVVVNKIFKIEIAGITITLLQIVLIVAHVTVSLKIGHMIDVKPQ